MSGSNHIAERLDFKTICAGVLQLVNNYGLYTKLMPFIDPKLVFQNDDSPEREALRKILELLKILHDEGKGEYFSFTYFSDQILAKVLEPTKAQTVQYHYNQWLEDDAIKAKMLDDGSFSVFLDYLKILQIAKIGPEFNKNLQECRIDNAAKLMNDTLFSVDNITLEQTTALDHDDIIKTLEENNDTNISKRLYLDQPLLDDLIGGFEPQTLNGFISVTNGGKTAMAHHLIAQCIKQRMYAWVGVVEDRKKSFIYKIVARLTGIPIARLKKYYNELTRDEQGRVRQAVEDLRKYVHVEYLYEVGVEFVHAKALEYDAERTRQNKPKAVVNIVDYTGHIANFSYGDKTYEKIHNAYTSRKNFALNNHKICFDFAQINRDGMKNLRDGDNFVISMENLSGSFDAAHKFDNLISINRNDDDQLYQTCRLYICKGRDNATGITVRVGTTFSCYRYDMNTKQIGGQKVISWDCLKGPKDIRDAALQLKQQEKDRSDGAKLEWSDITYKGVDVE